VSQTRQLGDTFLIAWILSHEDKYPDTTLPPVFIQLQSAVRPLVKTWIEGLPKVIWEMGGKEWSATERVIGFMLEMGRRGKEPYESPYSLIDASVRLF
jgi:pre-rRNA-processing protein IPI1